MKRYTTKALNEQYSQYGEVSFYKEDKGYRVVYSDEFGTFQQSAYALKDLVSYFTRWLTEQRFRTITEVTCELPLPSEVWDVDFNNMPEEVFPTLTEGYSIATTTTPITTALMSYRHTYLMFDGKIVDGGYTLQEAADNMSQGYWLSAWESYPERFRCELNVENGYESDRPSVITKSQALDLGYCFQYRLDDKVAVYCPDGKHFIENSLEQALEYLTPLVELAGLERQVKQPVLSGNIPSPTSYWLEPDVAPLPRKAREATLLTALGYNPDEYWVDLSTGEIFTLDGDVLVGTTSEQRW